MIDETTQQQPDMARVLRAIDERIINRGIMGEEAARMRGQVLRVMARASQAKKDAERSKAMAFERENRQDVPLPPNFRKDNAKSVGIPTGEPTMPFPEKGPGFPESPSEILPFAKAMIAQENKMEGVAEGLVGYGRSLQSGAATVMGTAAGTFGFDKEAEALRTASSEIESQSTEEMMSSPIAQMMSQTAQLAPSALIMLLNKGRGAGMLGKKIAGAGSTAAMGLGYVAPSAAQGINAYRSKVLAAGGTPDPAAELAQGVGFAAAEFFFERAGIQATADQLQKVQQGFSKAYLGHGARGLTDAATAAAKAMGVNASEELGTQLTQNALARTYDASQGMMEGTGGAVMGGALQGGVMSAGAGVAGVLGRPTRDPAAGEQILRRGPQGTAPIPQQDPLLQSLMSEWAQQPATPPTDGQDVQVNGEDAQVAGSVDQVTQPTPPPTSPVSWADQRIAELQQRLREQATQTNDSPKAQGGANADTTPAQMPTQQDLPQQPREEGEQEDAVSLENRQQEGSEGLPPAPSTGRSDTSSSVAPSPDDKPKPTFEHPGHDWKERKPVEGDYQAGRKGKLYLTNGKTTDVEYGIFEAEDAITTHDPEKGYATIPEGDLNERPYSHPTEGKPSRDTVQDITRLQKPETLISDDPTPVNGPPQLSKDLRSLGGNARLMGMKLIYKMGGPTAVRLKELMVEAAPRFGIDPEKVRAMKNPILGRRILSDIGPRGSMSRALNLPLTTDRTNDADAVSRGSLLKQEHLDKISSLFTDDEDTVRRILKDPQRATKMLQVLRESQAMSDGDIMKARNKDGSISSNGRDMIEKALLGSTIGDISAMAQASEGTRNKMLRGMASFAVLRNSETATLSGFNITDIAAAALDALASMKESGARSFSDLVNQTSMVKESWRDNPRAIALAMSLKEDGPILFAKKIREVANAASYSRRNAGQMSMFGDEASQDVGGEFDRVFDVESAPREKINTKEAETTKTVVTNDVTRDDPTVQATTTKLENGSQITARLAKYAGSADIPADVDPSTLEGATQMLDLLGITDETLKAKWWDIKDRVELAKAIAAYPKATTTGNTSLNRPDLRTAYKDQEARDSLADTIIEELLNLPQEADETKVVLGAGGGRPSTPVKAERVAYLLIGGPGAGKSTIVNKISQENGAIYISADTVKRKLPEFESMGVGFVHAESAVIAMDAVVAASERGLNLVMERTGGKYQDIVDFAAVVRAQGYQIKLVLVDVDRAEATRRVISRFTQTGRLVSIQYAFNGIGNNPLRVYNEAIEKGYAEEFEAYENDSGKHKQIHKQGSLADTGRVGTVTQPAQGNDQSIDRLGQGQPQGSDGGRPERGNPTGSRNGNRSSSAQGQQDTQTLSPEPATTKPPTSSLLTLSDKKRERLDDIFAKLRSSQSTLKLGVDPKDMLLAIEAAALVLEGGARSFAAWGRVMIAGVGRGIIPKLRQLYQMVRYEEGVDTREMTSEVAIASMTQADIEAMFQGVGDEQRDGIRNGADDRPTTGIGSGTGEGAGGSGGTAQTPQVSSNGGAVDNGEAGAGQPGGGGEGTGNIESGGRGETPVSQPESQGQEDDLGSAQDPESSEPEDMGEGSAGGIRDDAPRRVDPATLAPEDRNHVIAPDDVIAPKGNAAKLKANKKAIELLNVLEKDNRNPTPEEKKTLAQYTGWGWAGEYFNDRNGNKYAKERAQVEAMMTEEERRSASRSTTNAHFTASNVIRPMWDLVRRLGFQGGRVLEPAAGVGHFFGLMPEDIAAASDMIGVELDDITGRILKKLYPQADVRVEGFQVSPIANNSVDLAISNVPFGDYQITAKDHKGYLIHDYFFLRSIDKVKPGGLVVFITSDGTMNKLNTKVRSLLAEKADLVGAIRLPNNAFAENAGTEVTTDIIVLRKKDGRAIDSPSWMGTTQIGTQVVKEKDPDNPNIKIDVERPIIVNEYFANRPEMALGKHTLSGTMYSSGDYALVAKRGQDTEALLQAAIQTFPENLISQVAAESGPASIKRDAGDRVGSYVTKNGEFYQVYPEELKPADWLTEKMTGNDWAEKIPEKVREKRKAIATKWMKIRDAVKALNAAERNPESADADIEKLRKKLKKEYQAFTDDYGTLNRVQRHLTPGFFLENDPDYYLVQSLENEKVTVVEESTQKKTKGKKVVRGDKVFRQTTEYVPHAIFEKRMQQPRVMPDRADSPADAIAISMGWYGHINVTEVARLLGTSEEGAKQRIMEAGQAFVDPATGMLIPAERYLSGNVRKKLEEARAAAEQDQSMRANVDALEKAQPVDVSIADVKYTLASRWLPTNVVEKFAKFILDVPTASVSYSQLANGFEVRLGAHGPKGQDYVVTGRDRSLTPRDLLMHALNGTKPALRMNIGTSRTPQWVADVDSTKLAEVKVDKLSEEFLRYSKTTQDTVTTDKGEISVQAAIEAEYNAKINNVVPVEYKGDYLVLPGLSSDVRRLPHRLSVVARILQEGAAVMAHGVGSGKTFSLIVAAMELKRLGLAKKTMIAVQKSTIGQFAASFMQAYPDAKILVANENTFAAKNRKRLMAQIQLGDWDAVIVTHPQFDRVQSNPQRIATYVRAKMEELRDAIAHEEDQRRMNGEVRKTATQKQLEARLQKLQAKLDAALFSIADRSDNNVYFEDMGVDFMMVDEAHSYKRASIITRKRSIKGIPTDNSAKALNLEIKTEGLQEKSGGKGVVLATGTPITNTMAEAYVMMKLAVPNVLKDFGFTNFDEFADTFGTMKSDVERTWSGQLKVISRFKRFMNGPEFIRFIRSGFDVKMGNKELGLEVPAIKGGKPEQIILNHTPATTAINDWLLDIGSTYENASPQVRGENSWVPITTMQAGMVAAVDPRLIDPNAEDDPNSKVNTAVRRIFDIHKQWEEKRGTQIVFADRFAPMSTAMLQGFLGGGVSQVGGIASPVIDMDTGAEDAGDSPTEDVAEESESGESAASMAETLEYKSARFNLYQDMKAKLIKMGVPAHEIAVVHDFNTDERRKQLFEDLNTGAVRILIGSTEKAGVGVNVQARLVALHELDPPRSMTPAMQEQRHGRIIRQGNMFATKSSAEYDPDFEVELIQYGLVDSMEAGIFQLLENKLKFITQALMGKAVGREFEDPAGEAVYSVAEMKAKLTGDTRLVRMAELSKIISDLSSERSGVENQAAVLIRDRDFARMRVDGQVKHIRHYKAFLTRVNEFNAAIPTVTAGMSNATGEEDAKALINAEYKSLEAALPFSKTQSLGVSNTIKINGWNAKITVSIGYGDGYDPATGFPPLVNHYKAELTDRTGETVTIKASNAGRLLGGMKREESAVESGILRAERALVEYQKEYDNLTKATVIGFDPEKAKALRDAQREYAMIERSLTAKPGSSKPPAKPAPEKPRGISLWLDTQIEKLETRLKSYQVAPRPMVRTRYASRPGHVLHPLYVIDAAYLTALKALKAGVKGGQKLTAIISTIVSERSKFSPDLVGKEKLVRKLARKWLALNGDEQKMESLYEEARTIAMNPRTLGEKRRAARAQRDARKEAVGNLTPKKDPGPKVLSEKAAFLYGLKQAERATSYMAVQAIDAIRRATKQANAIGQLEATIKMEKRLREAQREIARLQEVYSARKSAHTLAERKLARAQVITQLRTDLADMAKTMPMAVRGKLISAIRNANTVADLRRAVNRGILETAKFHGKTINKNAAKANKHLPKLNDDNRNEFTKARTALVVAYKILRKMGPKDIVGTRSAVDPVVAAAKDIAAEAIKTGVTKGTPLTELIESRLPAGLDSAKVRRLVQMWMKRGATADNLDQFADVAAADWSTTEYRIDDAEVQQALDLVEQMRNARGAMNLAVEAQQGEDDVGALRRNQTAKNIRGEMVESVSAKAELPTTDRAEKRNPSRLKQFGRKYWNTKTLFYALDGDFTGNGPAYRLYKRMAAAHRHYLAQKYKFVDAAEAIVKRHGFESMSDFLTIVSGELGATAQKTVKIQLLKVDPDGGSTKTVMKTVTLGEALYIYAMDDQTQGWAHKGAPFVFDADRDGAQYYIPDNTFADIRGEIGTNMVQIVDEMKAAFDGQFWEPMNAVSKRLRGRYLQKVPRYWGVQRAAEQGTQNGVPPAWKDSIPLLEESSMLQERTGGNLPIIIGDFGTSIVRRADASAAVIAKADVIRLARMTLLHPKTRTAINNRMGASVVERLDTLLMDYAGKPLPAARLPMMNTLTSNVSRSYTQMSIPTWFRNIGSTFRLLDRYSPQEILVGMVEYSKAPYKTYRTLQRLSPVLRDRYSNGNLLLPYAINMTNGVGAEAGKAFRATMREAMQLMLQTARRDKAGIKQAASSLGKAYMKSLDTMRMGNLFDASAAGVAYHIEKRRGTKARDAARIAEGHFQETANTNDMLTETGLQRDAKEDRLVASQLTFTSDIAKAQNMLYVAWHRGPKQFARTAAAVVTSIIWSASVTVGWAFLTGKPDTELLSGVKRAATELIALLPGGNTIGGRLVGAAFGASPLVTDLNAPILQVFNDIGGAVYRLFDAIDDSDNTMTRAEMIFKALGRLAGAVGSLFGLPVGVYVRAIANAYNKFFG